MRSVSRSIVVCVGLALLRATASSAQVAGGFEELTLAISTASHSILPMQVLPLTVTVSNATDHPVWGHDVIRPGGPFLKIYLARGRAAFSEVDLRTGVLAHSIGGVSKQIPAGYARCYSTYFWWGDTPEGKGRALFSHPGDYSLKTTLTSAENENTIESNILTITVAEPSGSDSTAWHYLKHQRPTDEPDAFPFWVVSGIPGKASETMRKLEDFALRFPRSTYAAYAWYALGEAYESNRNQGEAGTSYQRVLKWKNFALRDDLLYNLSTISVKRGDIPKAKHYLAMLRTEYPSSDLIAPIIQRISTAEKAK